MSISVSITTPANGSSHAAGSAISFTSGVSSSNFVIDRHWDFGDGTSASTSANSKTYSTAGTYEVTFSAINELGEEATDTITITVTGSGGGGGGSDTTAPSDVTIGTATQESSSSIEVTWSAATDNVAVTDYKIRYSTDSTFATGVQETTAGSGAATSKIVSNLLASTTYYFQVKAQDAAGNESASWSSSASAATAAASAMSITTATLAACYPDEAYSQEIVVAGGSGFITRRVTSGSLPAGIDIVGDFLKGKTSRPGNYPITVTAYDQTGLSASANYTLQVTTRVKTQVQSTVVDQLKHQDRQSLNIELAYGRHLSEPDLVMSNTVGTDPSHQTTIRVGIAEGLIQSVEGAWYEGTGIDQSSVTLYDGSQTTAPNVPFSDDQPHFGTAVADVVLPTGMAEADTVASPPQGLKVIARHLKVKDYDSSGAELSSGARSYSTNPARCIADLVHARASEPVSRTDWSRWADFKDFHDQTETVDYTTLEDQPGFGLTASVFSDTSFTTFVQKRVDPNVWAELGEGSPAYGCPVDDFSVRWEGKIKAPSTGTYTFYLDHDDLGKLYVDDLVTPLINNASAAKDSATIALTEGEFYDIKVEMADTGGSTARCSLTWIEPAGDERIVPTEYLYPKAESKELYACNTVFRTPLTPRDALSRILLQTNSFFQEADGTRKFYCFDELATPTFDFTESNIYENTFTFRLKDRRQLSNRFTASSRDLDSQYLRPLDPAPMKEYPELQNPEIIEAQALEFDSMTRWQAIKILNFIAKRDSEMLTITEFDGTAATYPVLPGDLVTVTHTLAGWTEKTFLCIEAIDYSPESTPDRRHFTLLEWTV